MPAGPILQALRVQLAFLVRLTCNSPENNLQFSGETLAFLMRNGSFSPEKRKYFSGELDVFLMRNESSSRRAVVFQSGGIAFATGRLRGWENRGRISGTGWLEIQMHTAHNSPWRG